jgi:hypothetical protein
MSARTIAPSSLMAARAEMQRSTQPMQASNVPDMIRATRAETIPEVSADQQPSRNLQRTSPQETAVSSSNVPIPEKARSAASTSGSAAEARFSDDTLSPASSLALNSLADRNSRVRRQLSDASARPSEGRSETKQTLSTARLSSALSSASASASPSVSAPSVSLGDLPSTLSAARASNPSPMIGQGDANLFSSGTLAKSSRSNLPGGNLPSDSGGAITSGDLLESPNAANSIGDNDPSQPDSLQPRSDSLAVGRTAGGGPTPNDDSGLARESVLGSSADLRSNFMIPSGDNRPQSAGGRMSLEQLAASLETALNNSGQQSEATDSPMQRADLNGNRSAQSPSTAT